MKIKNSDIYDEAVDNYLTDECKKSIAEAAEREYGSFNGLTIGQWANCMSGNFACVIADEYERIRGTWLQAYWVRMFIDEQKGFVERLANLSPKMDADEERAAADLLDSTIVESVLVFARSYFGLHSFKEAEQITLGEVLIAKKAVYNETVFRRRLTKIQMENAKRKSK